VNAYQTIKLLVDVVKSCPEVKSYFDNFSQAAAVEYLKTNASLFDVLLTELKGYYDTALDFMKSTTQSQDFNQIIVNDVTFYTGVITRLNAVKVLMRCCSPVSTLTLTNLTELWDRFVGQPVTQEVTQYFVEWLTDMGFGEQETTVSSLNVMMLILQPSIFQCSIFL
jgi:hypothetical protein